MPSVFTLEHLHIHKDGEECWKKIEVCRNCEDALSAIDRAKVRPGFGEHPNLINHNSSQYQSGFNIDEYQLNQNH